MRMIAALGSAVLLAGCKASAPAESVQQLMKNKVDPRLTRALAQKQEEFAAVSKTNVTHLERMRACSQRLSDRIMQSARDAVRGNAHCYGARGHLEHNERRVSLSLNESA